MSKVTDSLTAVLVDTYALAVKTHAAHWNVTGAQFFALHEAFGTQYEELLDAADALAERIRSLGERAPRGLSSLAEATSIEEVKGDGGLLLAKSLRDDHRAVAKTIAKALKAAQAAGDEATTDLLIGRIEVHEKTAWMLDATAS